MPHTLLFELGTEELPPTSLKELATALRKNFCNALTSKKIEFSECQTFATPRRLALLIQGISEATPIVENKMWGPPANVAFDKEGQPTKAAQAFANKNGLDVDQLETANDGKQDKLFCVSKTGGESTLSLVGDMLRDSLSALPIKKRMRWGAYRDEFVRPVQWSVLLVDNNVVEENIIGTTTSNVTYGHRFHANHAITISNAEDYATLLENEGKVIACFDRRQAMIKEQVEACADKEGGQAVIGRDLLDEVTALVEWPVALAGNFEERFLSVPSEALISSMKEHQKYFHLVDNDGNLLPKFITVSNIESTDPAQVVDGNERVIRPRLSDAAFFFETDKKSSLESRREKLKSVTFQAQLGSVYDKTMRIKRLAKFIAEEIGADASLAQRSAELCKSDLVSAMVYEFPELQGIAGSHYALNDKEQPAVAQAMIEQYEPKFAGDSVPASDTGAIIALADRLDTITGIFGIGQKPSGSKDPFALRRASLGALRILVEKNYALDLAQLIDFTSQSFEQLPQAETVVEDVLSYCIERFRAWYQDDNIAAEVFQAVRAKNLTQPVDINKRVYAVAAFSELPEAPSLADANKRVSNILAKLENFQSGDVDTALLSESAEQALFEALQKAQQKAQPLLDSHDYTGALTSLAALKEPVDAFFDNVMVMCDDEKLRNNRLALLDQLRNTFLEVADISQLVVKK